MLVVLEIKFDYEERRNINEGLGNFGFWSFLYRQWNLKSVKRLTTSTKKNFRNWRKKCKLKLLRKQNLNVDTNQSNKQSLAFSNHLLSIRRNETQNHRLEIFFSFELGVWTGGNVMLKKRSKNKNNHTQNIWRKRKCNFFENWIEKGILKEKENEKHESYLYSTERNQCYDLILQFWPKGFLLHVLTGTSW